MKMIASAGTKMTRPVVQIDACENARDWTRLSGPANMVLEARRKVATTKSRDDATTKSMDVATPSKDVAANSTVRVYGFMRHSMPLR